MILQKTKMMISSVSDVEDPVITLRLVMLRNIRKDTIWIDKFDSLYLPSINKTMIHPVNNSLYGTTEEMQDRARKRNDEELDRICKKYCLILGWMSILALFIYIFFMIIKGPNH